MKHLKNNLPRPKGTDRHTFILERCKNRRVLHLGCVDRPFFEEKLDQGTLLHARLATQASQLVGLDNDEHGLSQMKARGWETILADAEELAPRLADTSYQFDLVVAGEIIEHLDNPGLFLDGLAASLKPGTEILLTTANAYASFRFARLLFGREDVHPDHVCYYSFHTLRALLSNHQYIIDAEYPYPIGAEITGIKWFYRLTERITMAIQPWTSDGIIVVARTPLQNGLLSNS